MAKSERIELLKKIEGHLECHCISYVTSTRGGLDVPMAMDAVRRVYDHLLAIDKPRDKVCVSLYLHSNGGDGVVPWRLVTLIREYAQRIVVLVPYRAFSAATLTALGANEIIMHPMGMLGPTDPTVANPFNPPDPSDPSQRLGISVEDVTAFIALVKEDVGIHHEDELVQTFLKLAEQVHPLALGNVKRSLSQSRMMAKKLLSLHLDGNDEHKITEIVDKLTSRLFFHGHPINRSEARDEIGLTNVKDAPPELERLLWQLYLDYEEELKMDEPFQPAMEFLSQYPGIVPGDKKTTTTATAKLVYVESGNRTDVFSLDYKLSGEMNDAGLTTAMTITTRQGWVQE